MDKITVVLGTAREGNFSQKVAEIVFDHLKQKELNFEIIHSGVDIANVRGGIDEERVKRYVDTMVEEIKTHLS